MLVGREEVGVAPRQGRCPTVRRGVAVDAPSMRLVPGRSSLLPVLEISLGFIDPPFPWAPTWLFAATLKDLKVWIMNVVPINSLDTLPIIYERGLFGMYHDWCESFSTYPSPYDLLHADHLFSDIKKRCKPTAVVTEIDRILRPEGHLIIRDKVKTIGEMESLAGSLQWKIRLTYSKDDEGLLCIQKTFWRPTETETITTAIA
ncbi:hypothetical protein U1Q18_037234 [Sarracenia purpurea var. burkii]